MTSAYLLLAIILHQISTWQYAVGAAVFAFILYLVGRLFINDEDESETTEAPVRSIVATPRAKRIQPAGSGPDETNGPSPFSETVANIPSDSLAAPGVPWAALRRMRICSIRRVPLRWNPPCRCAPTCCPP